MSQSIQIYSGTGASDLCVKAWKRELAESLDLRLYKIEEFNAGFTAGIDRGNIALLIFPGGNACEMFDPLLQIAGKINQVVGNQAAFLGSCAGAIVSSSNCSLQLFDFNPIPFHSKYYMPKSNSVADSENKSALEVEWLPSSGHFQSDPCRLFHAYGPSFPIEKITHSCRILAQYKTDGTSRKADQSAAAVLYKPSSATPRLLAGVHPELGVEDVLSDEFAGTFNKPDHPHIKVLAGIMEGSETLRKAMCKSWFSELGLQVMER